MQPAQTFIERFSQWAAAQSPIEAVALVGSWARGAARADSDVDLVIVASDPQVYLADTDWISAFGSVTSVSHEDWGLVQSKRVFFENGLEVEFGITTREWTQTGPVDPGTAQVVRDGMKILVDRGGVLQSLQAECEQGRYPRRKT